MSRAVNRRALMAAAGALALTGSAVAAPRPDDMVLGRANAPIEVVEYASLTCPHCAHFHTDVLPELEQEFIVPGAVKLIVRHFPLNEPALEAAKLVECAGSTGASRANFMKALFSMQQQWAFTQNYLEELKKIAMVGGIDSAAFESCKNDAELTSRIVSMRQQASQLLQVNSTPSFFINGAPLNNSPEIDHLREAIRNAKAAR